MKENIKICIEIRDKFIYLNILYEKDNGIYKASLKNKGDLYSCSLIDLIQNALCLTLDNYYKDEFSAKSEIISRGNSLFFKPLIKLALCYECKAPITSVIDVLDYSGILLNSNRADIVSVLRKNGVKQAARSYNKLCNECYLDNSTNIICYICRNKTTINGAKFKIGNTETGLHCICNNCYETVSAKEYQTAVDFLESTYSTEIEEY